MCDYTGEEFEERYFGGSYAKFLKEYTEDWTEDE